MNPWLDDKSLVRALGGHWDAKDKTAIEYPTGGSHYRTYKPMSSQRPDGGLFVSTKIDHIRAMAKDDHAVLELTFDAQGQLMTVHPQMEIQGYDLIDLGVIGLAGATVNPGAAATAYLAGKALKGLVANIQKLNEHGGRALFPSVVEHNVNLIANNVRANQPDATYASSPGRDWQRPAAQ